MHDPEMRRVGGERSPSASPPAVLEGMKPAPLLWLFAVLFSLNYLIGFIRFRGWLKRGAKQAIADGRKKGSRAADAA